MPSTPENTGGGDDAEESTIEALRERLGLPEKPFAEGPPPRPVDIEQVRAYHAGELASERPECPTPLMCER